jgi:hypothetical protein
MIHTPSRRSSPRGQSLAEFALVFPIFFLVFAAIVQFGLIFWAQNTLTQVVRDTGRWAATQQQCTDTISIIGKANQIAQNASLFGYTTGEWDGGDVSVAWSGSPCPPTDNQDVASVEIEIHHAVPIFFPFVPGPADLASSVEFRMEPAP